jgi:hypothetical protein
VTEDASQVVVALACAGLTVAVGACFTRCVQELYERLVEAERQRAQDLREIAMALASGKKGKRQSTVLDRTV